MHTGGLSLDLYSRQPWVERRDGYNFSSQNLMCIFDLELLPIVQCRLITGEFFCN